jgi:glycosyltransferase involved in cell wall biosynthesis
MSSPDLSVVIPSVNGLGDLIGCIEALELQRKDCELEIIVVDRLGKSIQDEVHRRFSDVVIISVALSTTIPEMRATAFRQAQGNAIAVIEDHVIVPPGWARQMLDALEKGADIVGGSVENAATGNLMDWAAFLCEYSHCIPPIESGSVTWLTGNNVIYRKKLLEEHREITDAGKWENYLHDTLRDEGVPLICHPEIVVGHKKHYTFQEYMSQRYLYARSYAGARVKGEALPKRIFYGLAAFILPPLLFYRIVTRIHSKGKHRALLFKSLPLIALFVISWGLGEIVGYWFGAGDSLAKVC